MTLNHANLHSSIAPSITRTRSRELPAVRTEAYKQKRVKQRELCTHRYIFRALWTRSCPREDSNPCLSQPSLPTSPGGDGGGAVGARVPVRVRVRDTC
jgi:hypothetical protein